MRAWSSSAAWYSPFSLRSPWPRATLIRAAMSRRPAVSNPATSALRAARPASVIGSPSLSGMLIPTLSRVDGARVPDEQPTGPIASGSRIGHDFSRWFRRVRPRRTRRTFGDTWTRALNRGILDVIDETRGELAEHARMKVVEWRTASPDFHTTIETLVAEDDWVAYNVRHEGTHEGEFEGVAPTGKRVEFRTRCSIASRMESWSRTGDCTTTKRPGAAPRRVVVTVTRCVERVPERRGRLRQSPIGVTLALP